MKIWIDADACPVVVRELLIKSALRCQIIAIFVANRPLKLTSSPLVKMQIVEQGFDAADRYIASHVEAQDLVITSDIPLAYDVINHDAQVLTPHGVVYDMHNIKQALNMRDFMDTMRATGVMEPQDMGKQKPYSMKDKQLFANELHKLLREVTKSG